MPLYEEACSNCGRIGTKRAHCPRCPCVYCHEPGHSVAQCAKAKPCEICGQKGHKSVVCHQAKRPRPVGKSENVGGLSRPRINVSPQAKRSRSGPSANTDVPLRPNINISPAATGARGAASGEQRARLNIQVQPPRHDHELWLNLPEEVRNVSGLPTSVYMY